MIIIGIDPGITGAIAVIGLDTPDHITVWDMPVNVFTSKVKRKGKAAIKTTNKVDPCLLHQILQNIYYQEDCAVYLEQVNAMPGQGVVSMFNFGMGYGVIQGVLGALDLEPVFVHPAKWKKFFDLQKRDKDDARLMVKSLYPYVDRFERKKDGGRADATLIARYGMMTYNQDS